MGFLDAHAAAICFGVNNAWGSYGFWPQIKRGSRGATQRAGGKELEQEEPAMSGSRLPGSVNKVRLNGQRGIALDPVELGLFHAAGEVLDACDLAHVLEQSYGPPPG